MFSRLRLGGAPARTPGDACESVLASGLRVVSGSSAAVGIPIVVAMASDPTSGPKVELLWWSGCPSWERAIAELREEMAAAGLDPDSLVSREVASDDAAEREGFIGSPTIRVDGRDVQPTGDEPAGLRCRIYRLRDGRYSPLPDRADFRDALTVASSGS